MCRARGVCLELLQWWDKRYTTHDAKGGLLMSTGFTTHLLITQATVLLNYKRRALQDDREGAPGCTLSILTRQIENVLLVFPGDVPGDVLQQWRRRVHHTSDKGDLKLGFSSEDWGHVRIKKRDPPQNYRKHFSANTSGQEITIPNSEAPTDFFPIGFTPFDKAVMEYSGAGPKAGQMQEMHQSKRIKHNRK